MASLCFLRANSCMYLYAPMTKLYISLEQNNTQLLVNTARKTQLVAKVVSINWFGYIAMLGIGTIIMRDFPFVYSAIYVLLNPIWRLTTQK
jgi:hypothetical protein